MSRHLYGSAPVRDGTAANDPDADGKTYRFLKLFHVFNVEQIDDLPPDFGVEVTAEPRELPAVEAFNDEEAWSATLAHEAVHFTGHSNRLDRLKDYARDRKARAKS